MDSLEGYSIGYTVLAGLWITPLAILWFISLCLARRRDDPARVGVAWLKAAYPIWIIALILFTVEGGLVIFAHYTRTNSLSAVRKAEQAAEHLDNTGIFFGYLADILLFTTFVELGSGFLLCLNGGSPTRARHPARYSILAWGFLLLVLSITEMGLAHSETVKAFKRQATMQMYLSMMRLLGALEILFWLTTIPVLVFTAYVVHKTTHHPGLRSGAVLLLVAAILNFIRQLVGMSLFANYILVPLTNPFADGEPVVVSYIVAPIFDYAFMFVVLVLLFALAVRKQKGLWSRSQPGWTFVTGCNTVPPPAMVPVAVPVAYPHPQQPMAPVPAAYQPTPGLPAYLAVAQQQQQMAWQQQQQYQQQQGVPPPQGYYYYPQQQPPPQPQPPAPAELKDAPMVQEQPAVPANGFQAQPGQEHVHGQGR